MQTILAGIAVVAAALGLLYSGFARRAAGAPSGVRSFASAGWASALPFVALCAIVLFLLTLPASGPFAPGLTLGWGFLIGVAAGLIALWTAPVASEGAIAALSAAALAPSIVLILFRGYPNDALAGCALGAAFVAACLVSLLRPAQLARLDADAPAVPGAARVAELYSLATAAASAGAWLAIVRYPRPQAAAVAGGYWALPGLVLAAGALALIVFAAPRGASRSRALLAGLGAAAVAVVLLAVLQWKLMPKLSWPVAAYGALAVAFGIYVMWREDAAAEVGADPAAHRPALLAVSAGLLAIMAASLAFRQMQGYGEALAAVAAALVVASVFVPRTQAAARVVMEPNVAEPAVAEPAMADLAGPVGMAMWTIIVLLAWLRVFWERTGLVRSLDFQQQYSLLATVAGAAAAFGLLGFFARGAALVSAHAADRRVAPVLMLRTLVLGLLTAAVPLVIGALWGERAVAALLGGFLIAEVAWMLLSAWSVGAERVMVLGAAPHVFLVAAALIAVQIGPVVMAMELTRAHKVILVAFVGVLALAWLIFDAFRGARAAVPVARPGEVRDEPAI